MITLDKNYNITINSTHGFELNYESDPYEKEVRTKKGKEVKMVTSTDTYYYPSLSMTLQKYFNLSAIAADDKKLLETVLRVENNINNFSKVFAKGGKIFEL